TRPRRRWPRRPRPRASPATRPGPPPRRCRWRGCCTGAADMPTRTPHCGRSPIRSRARSRCSGRCWARACPRANATTAARWRPPRQRGRRRPTRMIRCSLQRRRTPRPSCIWPSPIGPPSIVAARTAHDPLRAIRARLLRAEAERRQGRVAAARADLHHLRRITATLPPILRVRWQAATAVVETPGDAESIVARHVAGSMFGALPLYVDSAAQAARTGGGDPFVEQLIGILHVCQTADEDGALLKQVCERVRSHLHAAAVAAIATR